MLLPLEKTFIFNPGRNKRILFLALPIIGGMISQNIMNLVDTAMVGILGTTSLAAVGLGGILSFVSGSLIMGVSVGVQAIASRRKGEKDNNHTAISLNAGILLILIFAPFLMLILYLLTPHFFPIFSGDSEVIAQGIPYLQWRILGIAFLGINFAFRGYWNGVDRSAYYMISLLLINGSNILLNYVFIFGRWGAPALGTTGAGIATTLSLLIGNIFYFILGAISATKNGFITMPPRITDLLTLIRLSLPNGIQQFFLAVGYAVFYWIIGQMGTNELAAVNVLINIFMVAMFPAAGFGMASATLIGQALGRKDSDDAYQWAFDTFKIGLTFLTLIGIPMWLVPRTILNLFIHDPVTLEITILPLKILGLTVVAEAGVMVFMHSLLGAGDTKRVMYVSIVSHWLFFLPSIYIIGLVMGYGLLAIWIMQCFYRFFLGLIFFLLWRKRTWSDIAL